MKTEQIIETLREHNVFLCECEDEPTTDPEGLRLTLDAAIERLQELELTIARYERIYDPEANAEVEEEYRKEIRQLARERDEARREAKTIRCFLDAGVHPVFPWEVKSE